MYINLTPHTITIVSANGCHLAVEPSGVVARVSTVETQTGVCPITGAPIMRREFGAVTGLPENGELCIVSAMVASACSGRAGVFAPDTGSTAIRNDAGQVIAVTRLIAA